MNGRERAPLGQVALSLRDIVKQQPGIHFRALGRMARVSSVGQLRHHVDRLTRQGMVVELEDGRFKRFFLVGDHDPHLRPALARFARRVPSLVGRLLLERPMNRTELRRRLGLADSTLGYHLARMLRAGDLVKNRGRNCCQYSLAQPLVVQKLIDPNAPPGVPPQPTPWPGPLDRQPAPQEAASAPLDAPPQPTPWPGSLDRQAVPQEVTVAVPPALATPRIEAPPEPVAAPPSATVETPSPTQAPAAAQASTHDARSEPAAVPS